MKKSLFLLILTVVLLPVTLQAQNRAKAIVIDSISVCDSLTWIDGKTHTSDTNVFYTLNDTVHVLVLHVNHSTSYTEADVTMGCAYTWHNRLYHDAGIYSDTLVNAAGCDSIVSINLYKSGIQRDTLTAVTACVLYDWDGDTLTASGFYSDTLHSEIYACDSITVLPLTIATTIMIPNDIVTSCGEYTWHGNTYTESGVYTHTDSDEIVTCDTVYTLELTLDTVRDTLPEQTFCKELKWALQENDTLTITENGFYSLTVVDADNCPRTTYRQVTIVPLRSVQDTIDSTRCGYVSYRFEGDPVRNTYRIYGDSTIQKLFSDYSIAVCRDSLSVVRCHAKPNAQRNDTIDACDSYAWNENTYTITTFDSILYSKGAANGCDSVQRVLIRISPSPVITAVEGDLQLPNTGDATIYASSDQSNAEFTWDIYTTGDSYEGDTLTLRNINATTDVLLTVTNPESGCYTEHWLVVLVGVGIDDVDDNSADRKSVV